MDAIEIMMNEHKNIKRALAVVRKMSIHVLNGGETPIDDYINIIDFVRNYADKHHHNKEEEILFKKMKEEIGVSVDAPISGMLVEHDFGRLFIKNLDEALQRVKNGDKDSRVDVIANAIGYADLLNRHIDKEDGVIYKFAKRSLKEDAMKEVNENCEAVEKREESNGTQNKYISILETLEGKWI